MLNFDVQVQKYSLRIFHIYMNEIRGFFLKAGAYIFEIILKVMYEALNHTVVASTKDTTLIRRISDVVRLERGTDFFA
jgi:hypothetical protein